MIEGSLDAESPSVIARKLRKNNIYLTSVTKKTPQKHVTQYFSFFNRVKLNELAFMSRQLSIMMEAGLSIVDSLTIIKEETDNSTLQEVISSILEDIEGGSEISDALTKYPAIFPDMYCQMIKAGEKAGILDRVLDNLANYYTKQDQLIKQIKSSLYYPVTIFIVAVIVITFLVTNIIPQFVSIINSMGGDILLPTRIVLGISHFIKKYWWLILGSIISVGLGFNKFKSTYYYDKYILKLPLVKIILQQIIITRFTATLNILLESQLDLLTSLEILKDVLNNKMVTKKIKKSRMEVKKGTSFSGSLNNNKGEIFPGMVVEMIHVGEKSGNIVEILKYLTDYYEKELETNINKFISLIEPIMILGLAVIVGFILISVLLPMFNMYSFF